MNAGSEVEKIIGDYIEQKQKSNYYHKKKRTQKRNTISCLLVLVEKQKISRLRKQIKFTVHSGKYRSMRNF